MCVANNFFGGAEILGLGLPYFRLQGLLRIAGLAGNFMWKYRAQLANCGRYRDCFLLFSL